MPNLHTKTDVAEGTKHRAKPRDCDVCPQRAKCKESGFMEQRRDIRHLLTNYDQYVRPYQQGRG